MRGTRVTCKVTRSTKLRGAQRSPELGLRSTDFRAPENLIFLALTFERIFSQTHSFLRKQTKAAHSNAAEKRISSMINQNKRSSRSSLSLNWALLFIVLMKTYIDNPFQWKPPSDFLEKVKKSAVEYNR